MKFNIRYWSNVKKNCFMFCQNYENELFSKTMRNELNRANYKVRVTNKWNFVFEKEDMSCLKLIPGALRYRHSGDSKGVHIILIYGKFKEKSNETILIYL